jgi:hypothetical protein
LPSRTRHDLVGEVTRERRPFTRDESIVVCPPIGIDREEIMAERNRRTTWKVGVQLIDWGTDVDAKSEPTRQAPALSLAPQTEAGPSRSDPPRAGGRRSTARRR